MFASNDLFDEEVQVDKQNASYQNSRPMTATSRAGASTTFERQNSNLSGVGGPASASSSNDPTTPTPAMRKAKMEEMRRAQLDKQRMKNMVAPAILRANEDQVVKSPVGATAASAIVSPQMSPHSFIRQPSDLGRGGSASPYAQPSPTGSRQLDFSQRVDSDDDEGGVAIAAYASPTGSHGSQHISSLLAEKQQSQRGSGSSAAGVAASAAVGPGGMSQAEREMLQQGIAPVFDPVTLSRGQPGGSPKMSPQQGYVPNVRLDLSDMRTFLQTPVPKGAPLLCYILRNKKGIMNKMYPTYEAYLSGDQERFLFGARKRTKNKTSNYLISLDKNEIGSGKESASYLGKVRSNFAGTEFVGYDKGCNPKDLGPSATPQDNSIRAELCAVFYQSNLFGSNGPRKMTAVLPSLYRADGTTSGRAPPLRPVRPEDSIAERYKLHPQSSEFVTLVNKTPQWNESLGAYVLDFNKRVTMASVKNFQLIQADEPDRVVLQFGRIAKDTFTMDVQHPMTPMQAFQICLTSFDYKFACE